MIHTRKPVLAICLFFIVACSVYFIASGDTSSLGSAVPVNMKSLPIMADRGNSLQVEPQGGTKSGYSHLENQGEYTETPFMPKMANETLKAQLGNSAWHLFHTVLARYPDKPTDQERSTLKQYIHLFAQVYPCGDCARHFQKLLAKFPPQVGSRKNAALWGCDIHNKVNEKLKKPQYDCTTILEDYDCGCGEDEKKLDYTLGGESVEHLRQVKVDEKGEKQLGG